MHLMNRLGVTLVVLALTGMSAISTADAQRIRNYGSDAEKAYGVEAGTAYNAPPGAPAAAPAKPTQQAATPEETAKEDPNAKYNTGITVFQRKGGTKEELKKLELKPEEMYRGVIPGTRDEVTHLNRARQKGATGTNQLIWVGFQPREQSTRVFFQTAREADYTIGREGNAIVLTFNDTKLSARNFGRFIDASFFNRNVVRIESKRVGKKTVKVTIQLREAEQPRVNTTSNYVYLDFSERDYSDSAKDDSDDESDSESDASPAALDE